MAYLRAGGRNAGDGAGSYSSILFVVVASCDVLRAALPRHSLSKRDFFCLLARSVFLRAYLPAPLSLQTPTLPFLPRILLYPRYSPSCSLPAHTHFCAHFFLSSRQTWCVFNQPPTSVPGANVHLFFTGLVGWLNIYTARRQRWYADAGTRRHDAHKRDHYSPILLFSARRRLWLSSLLSFYLRPMADRRQKKKRAGRDLLAGSLALLTLVNA